MFVMEIQFLGTSAGMPTKKRNVSGIAVKRANSKAWCLVDCGEGTQHRLLYTRLSLHNLQAVLITHMHGDHCFGLPGLIATAALSGRKDPLTIIGPRQLKVFVVAAMAASELTPPFSINYRNVEELSATDLGDFKLEVTRLSHRLPSWAYGFSEKQPGWRLDVEKLELEGISPGPEWGRLQAGEDVELPGGQILRSEDYRLRLHAPRKVVIAGDNDTPALLARAISTADVLVHEATYTQAVADRIGNAPRHSSAEMVARFAEDIGVRNLVLTHISPRYHGTGEDSIDVLENEARQFFTGPLFMANDFDRFHLAQNGAFDRLAGEGQASASPLK